MTNHYKAEELNKLPHKTLVDIVLNQQEQLQELNEKFDRLSEQFRIAMEQRFGRHSEKLDVIDGQLSLFNEAEEAQNPETEEPQAEEVVQAYTRKKAKGKRDADLSGLPEEEIVHDVPEEKLNSYFGPDGWRKMSEDVYKRLRYEPASWTVEVHKVPVYVGTKGDHQDEFLRGDRPVDLIRNSIVTPSLGSAIVNGKYTNALPLNRISQEFERNGLTLSRQTMANWIIIFAEKYFKPVWDRMHEHLLTLPVIQSDETPVQVIHTTDPNRKNCYMWVHRSGELLPDKPIILYEFQQGRGHEHPRNFYGDYHGVVVTDGLQQYHLVEKELPGLINANCWAHARRDFADACKAIGKSNADAMQQSIAHQALELIARIYHADEKLKTLTAKERLRKRKIKVKPLVDSFFAWVKEQQASESILPKGKTAEGLSYCINQEKYLRVFLTDGNVPIDNSASERAIRPFCIGKKNWLFSNVAKGAEASAVCYSLTESAKASHLKPYFYLKHLLTVMPELLKKEKPLDPAELDELMPWSTTLPEECYNRR